MKKCDDCGDLKDFSSFFKNKRSRAEFDYICIDCRSRKTTRKKVKNRRVPHGEGVTPQRQAHAAVKKAINSGLLVKARCEVCDTDKLIHAHHESYEREKWLDVIWLCDSHHKEWHVLERVYAA